MSTAEPGTRPVTFRAMFIEELRARRKQIGLLQREFAEKAHVSLSSVKKYEEGQKRPERKFAAWCDDFYGCPGTFERLYDGMVAESYPSWFGPRVLFEDKATCLHEWEMRAYRDCCKHVPMPARSSAGACRAGQRDLSGSPRFAQDENPRDHPRSQE